MALLAEEIVEEWLNRQGYFTIRGIKTGVDEIDILAVKPSGNGKMDCRHFEVQCSMRPVSYITRVPKEIQKSTGRAPNSAKIRSHEELDTGTKEWVEKKFLGKEKINLMQRLCTFEWSKELVINVVKSDEEVELIRGQGVEIHKLSDILSDLRRNTGIVQSASGSDLTDLVMMGVQDQQEFADVSLADIEKSLGPMSNEEYEYYEGIAKPKSLRKSGKISS